MSSFFDDDDEDESLPVARRQAGPPQQWGNGAKASSSRSLSREQSLVSESSLEVGGGGTGSRSFLTRLESTISPRRGRYSESIGLDSVLDGEDAAHDIGIGHEDNDELDLDLDDDPDLDDVQRMCRVWVKERGTVDIMQWEGDLMDTLFDKLEQQAKMVNTLRSDPQTSEEEHFKLVLVQTEMERVKFLIRSYVRTRLSKIEKYCQYILSTPTVHPLLSGAEMSHAKRYAELLHTHFQHSVLDSLPEWLRGMEDTYGDGMSMVAKPNKNVPVLIYCRKDCGEITLEGGEAAALAKGTTHLVKYNLVESWINLGWAEVL